MQAVGTITGKQTGTAYISQTERNVHSGVNRRKRITAPSGAVILF